jgi:Na+-transporting methylmalonyl-CoA/oxaloacetate decarboxylase gamma subunit
MYRVKKKTGLFFLLFVALFPAGAWAQRTTSMRINEVLIVNEDNFVDDYGKKNGWIELFNTSAGTVNIAGCFLTDDMNNPKKYPIPKGDVLTKIAPRQHTLFWADSMAWHGTFHLNFKFNPDKTNFVALFDSDGRTLIDSLTVPAAQTPDISYGRMPDGEAEWVYFRKVTPSTNNLTLDKNEKIDNFKTKDSWGIGMTISAMAVVFLGLCILFLVFKQVAKLSIKMGKARSSRETGAVAGDISGEVLAAIAAALYELEEKDIHDIEKTVLTIEKVSRKYSPWNSKIYGLRELPRK